MADRTGARRYWLIWGAAVPLALWALVRAFGLESGSRLTSLMWFTPYAAIGSETVPAAGRETLTVLSANVELGTAGPTALVALVDRHRPDLLSVQELTPSFARRLRRVGVGRRLPHSLLMPRPRGRGGGLYARLPLTPLRRRTHFRVRMPRAMVTLPGGGRVRVVDVHPFPPNMDVDEWEEVLATLPGPGSGVPWVLAGDFNATLDQAPFRDLLERGYRDVGEATGEGLEPTWPGPDVFPWGLMTIDHVLADRRLGIAGYGVDDLPGSDHRAIHAELVLP
jgi:endonuclease/exonuclease/phosphatase (EEP) superfamily protein YafD